MRKIFGGALLFSVVGAVIFGGVLAWKSTQVASNNSATVGSLNWTLAYVPNTSLIGPNGNNVKVGQGAFTNNGDFNLTLDNGISAPTAPIGDVTINTVDLGHQQCSTNNFHGTLTNLLSTSFDTVPPAGTGGDFAAWILVDPIAPSACIGATISYDVAINVVTVGS